MVTQPKMHCERPLNGIIHIENNDTIQALHMASNISSVAYRIALVSVADSITATWSEEDEFLIHETG